MDLNKAMVLGRVTQNPEVRTTPSGQSVASFSVATNFVWKNSEGEQQKKAEFHNVVVWGKLADICGQYLAKGRQVYIEGRIQTRSWEGQDGIKRYRTEIIGTNVIFLSSPQGQGAASFTQSARQTPAPAKEEEEPVIEQEQVEETPKPAKEKPAAKAQDRSEDDDEIKIEDIPF